LDHAHRLVADGADIIDVGGESTRPSSAPISLEEEVERVVPLVTQLANELRVPISIDTTKAEVARLALAAGAEVVNDVSGGLFDDKVPSVCAAAGAVYICGHLRGRSMPEVHRGEGVSAEVVLRDLADRLAALPEGLRGRTILDPGIGFGKEPRENVRLSAFVPTLKGALSCPVMVGPSRKRFLGALTGRPTPERDPATIGAGLASVALGANVVRVHNVRAFHDALVCFQAVWEAKDG